MSKESYESKFPTIPFVELNLGDPIDSAIAEYQDQIQAENTPTESLQQNCINGMRYGHRDSAKNLVRMNKGFLAVVAYPFKGENAGSAELMLEASKGLIVAAKTYSREETGTAFHNYAAVIMQHALAAKVGKSVEDFRESPFWVESEDAMADVYRLTVNARKPGQVVENDSQPEVREVINANSGKPRNMISPETGKPLTRMEQLARKLGMESLTGYNVEAIINLASPRQREVLLAYYLIEPPRTFEEASKDVGISGSAASTTAANGIARIKRTLKMNPHLLSNLMQEDQAA